MKVRKKKGLKYQFFMQIFKVLRKKYKIDQYQMKNKALEFHKKQ